MGAQTELWKTKKWQKAGLEAPGEGKIGGELTERDRVRKWKKDHQEGER